MTTDYRALCAELADALDAWQLGGGPPEDSADADLIARARAALAQPDPHPAHVAGAAYMEAYRMGRESALAQPEPEFTAEEVEMIQAPWSYLAPAQPEPVGPTDEELLELWQGWNLGWDPQKGMVLMPHPAEYARAVLTRWGRAGLADGPAVPEGREPASVVGEPSDEELLRIAAEAIDPYDKIGLGEYEAETECAVEAYGSELIAFARAVLARYSHQPAPPAEGEVAELVADLRGTARGLESHLYLHTAALITRAADLLEQRHPTPVPVAERLPRPEDCDAEGQIWAWYCDDPEDGPEGNLWAPILLRLLTVSRNVTHWLPFHALPLPTDP